MAMQAAYKALQDTAESVGLRLKSTDKKAEKALTQSLREDLESQLADQADPAAALSLVVPLLVMQVTHTKPCAVVSMLCAFLQLRPCPKLTQS